MVATSARGASSDAPIARLQILVAAVKTVFEELLWSLKRASSSSSPDLHQLQDVAKRRDALVASLQRLYDATQHTTLRSAVSLMGEEGRVPESFPAAPCGRFY